MAVTIDWDQVSTLARDHMVPVIKDQFFKRTPLLVRMRGRPDMFSGGRQIVQPLGFAPEGGGGQWWSGADKFDIRARNPITAANFYAVNYECSVVVLQDEEDQVNGPEQVLPLVGSKLKIAQRTVEQAIGGSDGLYNDGSNPKAIQGLQYALPASLASTTYGGISTTTAVRTWWNPQLDTTSYSTGDAGGGGDYIQATNFGPWNNMFAAQGLVAGRESSLILCNYGVWNDLQALVMAKTTWFRPQQASDMHEAGFSSFMYNRKTVVVDPYVPRNSSTKVESVFFVDEEAVHFWIHTARNFEFRAFREMIDQAARVAYIFFRGQLTFDERRTSGRHTAVDTTATSP